MKRGVWVVILLVSLLQLCPAVLAQDAALTSDRVEKMIPVAFLEGDHLLDVSDRGRYLAVASESRIGVSAQILDKETGTILALPENTRQIHFIDETSLLWISAVGTQSPRLYRLPGMIELGRFPLGTRPQALRNGSGFVYVEGSAVYFQPLDLAEPRLRLAAGLNYTDAYLGDLEELPDGQTLLIAGQDRTVLIDLETQSTVATLDYPLLQAASFSEDGNRLSMVTNHDAFTGASSIWRVYDLEENVQLLELFGQLGAHGLISASGRYAAVSQQVTYSGQGNLRVYELDTLEEIFRVEDVSVGGLGWSGYWFAGDNLIFLRDFSERKGFATIYSPDSDALIETDIEAMTISEPINEQLVPVVFAYEPVPRMGLVDAQSGELVRSFASRFTVSEILGQIIADGVVYAVPSIEQPALPALAGQTTVSGVNVRANPFPDSVRINGVSGDVTAIARNADSTWVYVVEGAGWVSADLISFDGDIATLTERSR
jgi:hypothetical protein